MADAPSLSLKAQVAQIALWRIQVHDPHQTLNEGQIQRILEEVSTWIVDEIKPSKIHAWVHEYIDIRVRKLVQPILECSLRFRKRERVVCNIGSEWLSGTIQAINEADPEDKSIKFPYVVKIDHPFNRLISAPVDDNDAVRAEVCFGKGKDSTLFTLFCLPPVTRSQRRFRVGERVACAVEDKVPDPTGTSWAAGTIQRVDISMDEAAKKHLPSRQWLNGACVPYEVTLDAGCTVLVHKDEHWLIRELAHQAEGPRQAIDGARCLMRIEKRQRDGSWETVDHTTRRVRKCAPPDSASDDD